MRNCKVQIYIFFFLLLSTFSPFSSAAGINIIRKSPPDGSIIKVGHEVRLSCETDQRWFFCTWKSPDGRKQCGIQQTNPEQVCASEPRIRLDPRSRSCDIVIKDVRPADFGTWMCLVQDGENFETDRRNVAIEVAQPASVTLQSDHIMGERNELVITEGETAEVSTSCMHSFISINEWL